MEEIDDELRDEVNENSLKEMKLARMDSIKRKMPRKVIRLESYDDFSKRASVEQRLRHNEEITDAMIRQAQRKADRLNK